MAVVSDSSSKPRRRWFRFSLGTLLIVIAALAVPLGWKRNRIDNQRRALAEAKRLNGDVSYDWQWASPPKKGPPGPKWLRDLGGDDFFADIHSISFKDSQANDDTLALVSSLPNLAHLCIVSDSVTDAGLLHLT